MTEFKEIDLNNIPEYPVVCLLSSGDKVYGVIGVWSDGKLYCNCFGQIFATVVKYFEI